jgi:hypothetical protein
LHAEIRIELRPIRLLRMTLPGARRFRAEEDDAIPLAHILLDRVFYAAK